MARLTDEIKAQILEMHQVGASGAQIARELELNASTVRNFISRHKNPTFTVAQFAQAFNMSEADVLAQLNGKPKYDFVRINAPSPYAPSEEVLRQIASKFEGTTVQDWEDWFGTDGRERRPNSSKQIMHTDLKYVAEVIGRELIYVRRLFSS